MKSVNIICMKWGEKFDASYVNKLYGMVSRNLTLPFRFVCFTENSKGIRDEVQIEPLVKLDLPKNIPERGWQKLSLFAKDLGGLKGKALFLDLDVVIVDNIDDFFTVEGDFLIVHDKRKPSKQEGNSSVFRFEVGKYPQILSFFEKNFEKIRSEVRHEQAYLSKQMHQLGKMKFWEDSWVPSFKYHCVPPFPISLFRAPSIPNGAKIILFHGLPNPPEAINGISGKWYRYIKPSPWILNYWRE